MKPLITHQIRGRTVDFVGVQDEHLIIATTDGQTYRIGWRDEEGLVLGEPTLEGIDMKLTIDPLVLFGAAGL